MLLPPQQCFPVDEGARMWHRGQYEAYYCNLDCIFFTVGLLPSQTGGGDAGVIEEKRRARERPSSP